VAIGNHSGPKITATGHQPASPPRTAHIAPLAIHTISTRNDTIDNPHFVTGQSILYKLCIASYLLFGTDSCDARSGLAECLERRYCELSPVVDPHEATADVIDTARQGQRTGSDGVGDEVVGAQMI